MGIAIFVPLMQVETCKVKCNTISDNLCNKLSRKDGVETATNSDENGIKAERLYEVCFRNWYKEVRFWLITWTSFVLLAKKWLLQVRGDVVAKVNISD